MTNDIAHIIALTPEDIAALPYEAARDLLAEVVEALDDSTLALNDLMKLWEAGEKIAAVCEKQLEAAAIKLNDGLPSEN